ncbi:hypothetical protein AHF37_11891 [Paragonimus kellicotti]|nr:hypothetical protein AHF37_11891 [Paragonimus kellicotti]
MCSLSNIPGTGAKIICHQHRVVKIIQQKSTLHGVLLSDFSICIECFPCPFSM